MHKVIDKQYTFVLFSPVFVYTESRSACTEPRSANQNLRLGSAFPRCCRPSVRSDVQSSPTFQRFDVQTCQRLDVFCSLPLFPCRPTPTPHYPPKLLRINTYKSLSKQRTLTLRRIYTYKKDGGVLWSTNFLLSSNVPTRLQPSFVLNRFHTLSFSVSCNSCICLPAVAGHSYENRGGVYQLFPFWNTFNRAGARDHSSPRCLCALSVSALSFSVLRFLTFNFELSIEDPERLGTVNFPPPLSRCFITSSSPALHWSAASPLNFMTTQLPSLVILGRPNVGKSTLFNRLTGTRRSIVTNEPGITRDRIYGKAEWRGRALEIVDTGGIIPDDKALIPTEIFKQARVAFEKAALLVLVVDSQAGLTPLDEELARLLRTTGKPFVIAVNKVDAP